MANVKVVHIAGTLPFNCDDDAQMSDYLAAMNTPTFGLRIHWQGESEHRPNERGGKTAFYNFSVTGREAVSYKWIDGFVKTVQRLGGKIIMADAADMEA